MRCDIATATRTHLPTTTVGLVVGALTGFTNEAIRSGDIDSISRRAQRRASSGTVGRYFDHDHRRYGGDDDDDDVDEDDADAAREEDALL